MPKLSRNIAFSYTDNITPYLDKIMQIPADVQKKMLQAEAEIIAEAERQTARSMLSVNTGNYYDEATGVAQAIAVGRMKKNRNENMWHTNVIFKGSQHGVRLGAIAFYNEYGALHMRRGSLNGKPWIQKPRPFIKTAINRASGEAVRAAEKIFFEDFINKY